MNIILLGFPGSGKSTQGNMIANHFNLLHISTGNILRSNIKLLNIKNNDFNLIKKGKLLPDNFIINMIMKHIKNSKNKNGLLFDGFPRTINQAHSLKKKNILINFIIELQIPEKVLIKRISGRRIHPSSGRIYHINFNPPKTYGIDDITGEPLIHREDDQENSIKNRLYSYYINTKPIIKYYNNWKKINFSNFPKFYKINANKEKEEIFKKILKYIKI
ncbi:nucleoside monophosphate kinase [Candidatus Legionella polyplacis]|uniref:Adenylate kinase n=1 Tax=Candidatus Legionella polyplacis TaxID=2005262 RepID=A0ABZ2GWU5_9GAMM